MIEPQWVTVEIEMPEAEYAAAKVRAERLGVPEKRYLGILALQGDAGIAHPEIVKFRNCLLAGHFRDGKGVVEP